MIPSLWMRWLTIAAAVVMLFGLSMLLAPGLIRQAFSLLIYADPAAIETRFGVDANRYIVLTHGVLGAVMFGWGTMMLMALRGPFARREAGGWTLLAAPLAMWFVTDTIFSLYTGFWQNAVLNSALLALFSVPLAATRRYFTGQDGKRSTSALQIMRRNDARSLEAIASFRRLNRQGFIDHTARWYTQLRTFRRGATFWLERI